VLGPGRGSSLTVGPAGHDVHGACVRRQGRDRIVRQPPVVMLRATMSGGKLGERMKCSVTIEELRDVMASLGMSGDEAREY